jgi:hypothetical protein
MNPLQKPAAAFSRFQFKTGLARLNLSPDMFHLSRGINIIAEGSCDWGVVGTSRKISGDCSCIARALRLAYLLPLLSRDTC